QCWTLVKDLTDLDAAKEVYEFVCKSRIKIDLLINNAGFNECGRFLETNLERELNIINLQNLILTYLTKVFSKAMSEQGGGKILNLGSTGSFAPFPYDAVYAASKAYVLSFSRAINSELKKQGVLVSTLCPGATNTLFAEKANIEKTILFRYFVMSPDKVARIAYRKLMKNKSVIVTGIYNKLLVVSMKLLPYCVIEKISPLFFS
ncbi:SDR family NAD(P)-dependent oxidoreductase, partial [uncultured Robinsoniella sp.]|uniref:SDR family NAD(P)-dependent oxidoreductase n=1 Tax=uncultured Robinsoniella sp. TaxID=904190 RepID=UPI00374E9FC4